jgi:hypothetical protein
VLLVDDDHAEAGNGREHRRARADRDAGLTAPQALPLAEPLALRQAGVQHRDLGPEARREAGGELRRQRDLRHQHDRALPGRERVGDHVQVDLGLAAAGHAMDQERREAIPEARLDRGMRDLLLGRERRRDRATGQARRGQRVMERATGYAGQPGGHPARAAPAAAPGPSSLVGVGPWAASSRSNAAPLRRTRQGRQRRRQIETVDQLGHALRRGAITRALSLLASGDQAIGDRAGQLVAQRRRHPRARRGPAEQQRQQLAPAPRQRGAARAGGGRLAVVGERDHVGGPRSRSRAAARRAPPRPAPPRSSPRSTGTAPARPRATPGRRRARRRPHGSRAGRRRRPRSRPTAPRPRPACAPPSAPARARPPPRVRPAAPAPRTSAGVAAAPAPRPRRSPPRQRGPLSSRMSASTPSRSSGRLSAYARLARR